MSDIAIYRAPEFRIGQLVDVIVQDGVRLTLRITDGAQDLSTGQWSYRVSFNMSYDEDETDKYRRTDGDYIDTFYVNEGGGITPRMLRPHVRRLAIEQDAIGAAVDAPETERA
jgi:hypothetical protein